MNITAEEMSNLNMADIPEKPSTPSMIVQQPGQQSVGRTEKKVPVFMAAPQLIPGVARGLEYLSYVSSISVHQLIEDAEVYPGIETRNRCSLCNQLGQQIYFAYEESSFSERMCFGSERSFTMHIMDNSMNPLMLIHRPSRLMSYDDECVVECPPGQMIGRVVLQGSCGSLEYFVQDAAGKNHLFIQGPSSHCAGGEVDYEAPVGAITKKWGGWAKEMFTDADTFVVNFPVNLDARLKATLLGATFLIDFIAYEKRR